MKNQLCLLLFLIHAIPVLWAQDTLEFRNGDRLGTKIIGVEEERVIYKEINDPEFRTWYVSTRKIKKIEFEDSTTVKFNNLLPHYAGLSVFSSAPLGNFSNDDSNDGSDGFATNGRGFDVHGGLFVFRNWGIYGAFGQFNNGFESTRFEENLVEGLPYDFSITAGSWNHVYFLIGPHYAFRMGDIVSGDVGLLFGDLSTSKPELSYSFVDAGGITYAITSDEGQGDGRATAFRLGIKIRALKNLDLGVHLNRIISEQAISYADTYLITSPDGEVSEEIYAGVRRQTVRVANLSLGLSYRFTR